MTPSLDPQKPPQRPRDQPSTLSTGMRGLLDALQAEGFAQEAALATAGLDPVWLTDPRARYPISAISRLWAHAHACCGDGIGIKAGNRFRVANWQSLGIGLLTAPDMQQALARLLRYVRLVSDTIEIELEVGDGRVRLRTAFVQPVPHENERLECNLVSGLRLWETALGRRLHYTAVELKRPRPKDPALWVEALGSNIRWASADAALLFTTEQLGMNLSNWDPALARSHEELLQQQLEEFEQRDVLTAVRRAVVRLLPSGPPPLERVAAALHMSERSLQRRLTEQDTCYRDFLDDIREQLARRYLEQGHSLAEVAGLLGFSDASNFSKAFRRWSGVTPGAVRNSGR